MTIFGIPRGPGASLVSFGSSNQTPVGGDRLIFSGSGSVSAVPMNDAPKVLVAGLDAFDYAMGQQFATDKTGMGGMPFKDSLVTWMYYVKATAGLSTAATWTNLESRLNQLYTWYWSTYTYTNAANTKTYVGASGQKGDLVVKAASGGIYYAPATWISFPDQIPPGQVAFEQVELVFHIKSHFLILPY